MMDGYLVSNFIPSLVLPDTVAWVAWTLTVGDAEAVPPL